MAGVGWMSSVDSNLFPRGVCKVVVVGDQGVGKTSLITAAATEVFPRSPPPVLPPTRLPADTTPERIPIEVVDTSSKPEYRQELELAVINADVVVICYALDQALSLQNVQFHWLPEIKRLTLNKPVVLVGCQMDSGQRTNVEIQQVIEPIIKKFTFVEAVLECSAQKLQYVKDVFHFALKALIYPISPLYDSQQENLKPLCVKALKRIFQMLDLDQDNALNDAELNMFQVRCFAAPLQSDELDQVKSVVRNKVPEGVNQYGLTLFGFLFLQALFIERGRHETTWTVLKKFGYNTSLLISDEVVSQAPEQPLVETVTELNPTAFKFLKDVFNSYDRDNDQALNESELDDLFSTHPENPFLRDSWQRVYSGTNDRGYLTRDGFLAKWAYLTLSEPRTSLTSMLYLGYQDDSQISEQIVGQSAGYKLLQTLPRRPKLDNQRTGWGMEKKKKFEVPERSVYTCFLFGVKGAGKAALLEGLLGLEDGKRLQTGPMVAIGCMEYEGSDKYLALKRITDQDQHKELDVNYAKQSDFLKLCDVAAFVFDSSNIDSFNYAHELMLQAAEASGHTLPCVFIATKDDLGMSSELVAHVKETCSSLAIPEPVSASIKTRNGADSAFRRILQAAITPEQYRPLTPALKAQIEYQRKVRNVLIGVGLVVGVSSLGFLVYKIYTSKGEVDENVKKSIAQR
eukprot:TRINITY_DN22948_c0_g3_i7.p1 TRINITY_DN22948_c0_g3~~TRINITY_DN22948_c0_g3_i7.p1  ORF type:complete len:685 (-),score=69.15 TRINITY_DN22948_c0_g3_i7:506-2560(-)